MIIKENCRLCDSKLYLYNESRNRIYLSCNNCGSIQLHPNFFLSQDLEKERYKKHNNDINDKKYQAFVSPIVNYVLKNFNTSHQGLDFGAGTGPVISKLLKDRKYNIQLFDPLFWNNPNLLNEKYDYVFACEVIEHFNNPKKEFSLLKSLLKPNGKLIIMTILYNDTIDFSSWFYKNDETHVFFYTKKTLDYIQSHYDFKKVYIEDRLIVFEN